MCAYGHILGLLALLCFGIFSGVLVVCLFVCLFVLEQERKEKKQRQQIKWKI